MDNTRPIMGKQRKKTKKELEKIVGQLAYGLEILRNHIAAIEGYVGAYIRWKGDELEYSSFIETELKRQEEEIGTRNKNRT